MSRSRPESDPYRQAARPPGRPPHRQMVWIPAGSFQMGSDHHYPEEAPAHHVEVPGFWIDRAPVTNAQFLKFVKATGHVTLAELPADASAYPEAQMEFLVPSSIVFVPPMRTVSQDDPYAWWQYLPGADWRHPEGRGSSIKGREHHPVVHMSHGDALAYATWAGKQLPTEAQWEWAARGGLETAEYAWGDELQPYGRMLANTFQGDFPHHNTQLDGWERTSPVGSFPANGYGLFDMIGNVWEWTDDWYQDHGSNFRAHQAASGCCSANNPRGATQEASIDPRSQHGLVPRKVVKGGSFLCAPSYCRRYRPAARMAQGIDTSTCHLGFRCSVPIPSPVPAASDSSR